MNILLETKALRQTKSLQKLPLPTPPAKETALDCAIRLAGITPIEKKVVVRHMREKIRAEKLRLGIPLWWSGAVQSGIETGLITAFMLTAGAFMVLGVVGGLLFATMQGTLWAAVPFIVTTGIAMIASMSVLSISISDTPLGKWRTPYWDSAPLICYQANMPPWLFPPLPEEVKEMMVELKLRLPEARFRVHYIEHAMDPILSVSCGFWGLRRRYLAVWE